MTNAVNLGEVITAMITPFKADDDQSVDLDAMELLAQNLLKNGSDALLLLGSTGEVAQLSEEEKAQIVQRMRHFTPVGTKLMVAASSNNTHRAIANAQKAFELGADAVLVAVPEYVKPSQKALFIHFNAVAQAIQNKPMMIYNIPGRTGKEILPKTVAELAKQNPNIFGIKQSMGNLDRVSELKQLCPPNFRVYSGDDSLTLPMLALGAHGVVSVVSHLEGAAIKNMISSFKQGKPYQALKQHQFLYPLFSRVSMHDAQGNDDFANPLPIKEALYQKGMIESPVARTLGEMSEASKQDMAQALATVQRAKQSLCPTRLGIPGRSER